MRSDLLFLQLTCDKRINIPQMYLPHLREETYLRFLKPFGYKVVTVSKRAALGSFHVRSDETGLPLSPVFLPLHSLPLSPQTTRARLSNGTWVECGFRGLRHVRDRGVWLRCQQL